MVPYQYNIVVNQGADFNLDLPPVTDASQNPQDLTDFSISSQIRKHYGANIYYSFTATAKSPATSGIINLNMTDIDTKKIPEGRYVYDVVITSDTGIKTRVFEGIVTINAGVTF